ncbi:MAG: hypothetical protein V3U87_07835 [Methylococcaceae bacterium]
MRVKVILVKVFLSSLLFFSFISTSYAEYDESELKDLFTTKKQRIKIDAKRFGRPVVASVKPQVKKKIKNKKVKVSGYVTRSNGKSVVWLNGKSTLKSSRIGDVYVQQANDKNKKVTVNVGGTRVQLKPGETWMETSGVSDPVK